MADTPEVENRETEVPPTDQSKEKTAEGEGSRFVDLFPGTELSATDAEAVTLRSRTHLVVFAGAAGSGKTTVIASIYEHLCKGPFSGFRFAASRTLLGFEQICHLNRIASGGLSPDTLRTIPADEATYFHLALRGADAGALRQHVLLSAISGELFRWAKNSREDCQRLTFLHRANTIVILVDGAQLSDPRFRTKAQSEASSLLDSFLDAQMIGEGCHVEFVFSKLDRILQAGDAAIDFLDRTKDKFTAKFGKRIPSLSFRRIAARPDLSTSTLQFDDGLAEAFSAWIATAHHAASGSWESNPPPADSREFSKFGWRHFFGSRMGAL